MVAPLGYSLLGHCFFLRRGVCSVDVWVVAVAEALATEAVPLGGWGSLWVASIRQA